MAKAIRSIAVAEEAVISKITSFGDKK